MLQVGDTLPAALRPALFPMKTAHSDESACRLRRSCGAGRCVAALFLVVAATAARAATPPLPPDLEPAVVPVGIDPGDAVPKDGPDGPVVTAGEDVLLDRIQQGLHGLVWRSAREVDSWMGPPLADEVYQLASGSVSAAVLWDEFDALDARVRFNVDVPLPRINERLHLFIGRFDPEEFVTEGRERLGVIPASGRSYGEFDETLAGLVYGRKSKDGSSLSGSVGGSVRSGNPDPYAKVSYQFRRAFGPDTQLTVRETVFYRASEGFGSTTRLHLDHVLHPLWHLRWTTSGTLSEESEGVRGFSTVTATRSLPGRRAVVFRASVHGETAAEVPLRDYGVKLAYRTSLLRPWFVLELGASVMWPRYRIEQTRSASLGVGIGCEMYFGNKAFSTRPVTF